MLAPHPELGRTLTWPENVALKLLLCLLTMVCYLADMANELSPYTVVCFLLKHMIQRESAAM